MNIFLDTARFFHVLLEQGNAIVIKRKELERRGVYLPAARIEILIKLEEIKKIFYERT
jgi:hypothetical protein